MILGRLAEALRRQDWFTVLLEVMIVVIGVFLGIQVANWNEHRQDRNAERVILQRLSTEVHSLIERQRVELATNRKRADKLLSSHPVLFGQEPSRALTLDECEGVAGSHVFRPPTDELPVLDEVRESDRFDLLTDAELQSRLMDYLLVRERHRGQYSEAVNELFRLTDLHPDLIWVERTEREPGYSGSWDFLAGEGHRWQVGCDIEAMRGSRAFLNHYADNTARRHFELQRYEERIAALEAVRQRLARLVQEPGERTEVSR